jgi:hypothetical protein
MSNVKSTLSPAEHNARVLCGALLDMKWAHAGQLTDAELHLMRNVNALARVACATAGLTMGTLLETIIRERVTTEFCLR